LSLEERFELVDCVPHALGVQAAAGEVAAGLLPLADYLRLAETFERIGHFGIAVRGRARSVLLFSRKPLRQLENGIIAVTEETSTSALVLRLVLEQRYRIRPARYDRVRVPGTQLTGCGVDEGRAPSRPAFRGRPDGGRFRSAETREREVERGYRQDPEIDALLLIGDEALRFQWANTQFPYEIDIAFEWWLWQHLPCVFAVWAIRKDASPDDKEHLLLALTKTLAMNQGQFERIAQDYSATLGGVPAQELTAYLSSFIYRLSQPEEEAIKRFEALLHEHHLF